ncbi:hypothetical protein BV898_14493 [Hypsibius exemplaris]|uniref:Chitin-binding type-2 domain-containing protein n=1 Tax=Hypsibius exemplaris TaxID=2072580 RepID=A0A9X6NFR5_HYPEX|nr:hypothetical protein BV898_14493 [Hypsibius exemplaris]
MAVMGDILQFLAALGVFSAFVAGTSNLVKRQTPAVPAQNPQVFEALDILRGSAPLSSAQIQQVLAYAYPGSSYPTYSYIPQTSFNCNQVRQFGFYADPETRCQVFRRCEAHNYMFSYICPNGTVFNQITLVCDWFYNVNCPSVGGFYDYSNPRIYRQDLKLFDDYYSSNYGSGSYGGSSGGANYGGASGSSYGILTNGYAMLPSTSQVISSQPASISEKYSTGNMYKAVARADALLKDEAKKK